MAGALGLRFGGPRHYGGESVDLPFMGDGPKPAGASDIEAGLALFHNAMVLLALGLILLAIAL